MEDPPLTAAQRSYLDAFDRLLRGEPGARTLMRRRLVEVLDEAEVRVDRSGPKSEPRHRFRARE